MNNREPIIWCPFDLAVSKYVEILKSNGFEVVHSHISEGLDFFKYQPEKWDIVVSNPPFSKKLDIFKRLVQFQKPFVLLMNMMALNYQNIGEFFCSVGTSIQFLFVDKKVSFNGKTSSFNSSYVCYKFLDRTEYKHLENNNTGANFRL